MAGTVITCTYMYHLLYGKEMEVSTLPGTFTSTQIVVCGISFMVMFLVFHAISEQLHVSHHSVLDVK